MSVPENIWRFPTREAINSLAKRFGFPNTPDMQDWEWEVADPNRINEFVQVYESGNLDDDEKFTLMETIIQSFADLEQPLSNNDEWSKLVKLIEENLDLHIYSVWYWSDEENDIEEDQWTVTPYMRKILNENREHYA